MKSAENSRSALRRSASRIIAGEPWRSLPLVRFKDQLTIGLWKAYTPGPIRESRLLQRLKALLEPPPCSRKNVRVGHPQTFIEWTTYIPEEV
jgi:hypothetical protein